MWQGATFIFFALALGLLINQIRPGGLPLVADRSARDQGEPVPGDTMMVSFDEARRLFFAGDALFLDARPPEDYREGHIRGARNLPADAPDEDLMKALADISQDALIIVYCHGETCTLSEELASTLRDMGFMDVRVLADGWGLWMKNDLPGETGPGAS
jgi:rhodanese-related sulfurtransferase